MPRPRPDQLRVQRPSPLKQVHDHKSFEEKEMKNPAPGLVRDPDFWDRFSTAVQLSEKNNASIESSASSIDVKYGDDWLTQQRKEKRRYRYICLGVLLAICVTAVAAGVVVWYLKKIGKL
ncbi:hypothetical protein F5884DRAFT_851721 [Xylogone sp. PMI_703]|nr:hypothetical protein F5884DRAFT_851721 [Xylogone sp. PMI_703]